jgi:hypothetical protein
MRAATKVTLVSATNWQLTTLRVARFNQTALAPNSISDGPVVIGEA